MSNFNWDKYQEVSSNPKGKFNWDKYDEANISSNSKNTLFDKFSHLIGADGTLGNQVMDFVAGFDNPISNTVNFLTEPERSVVNALGAPKLALPKLPIFPTYGGASSLLGNVAGTAFPIAKATKLVEGVEALPSLLSGLKGSTPNLGKAANVAREATIGALSGAASNPEGNRAEGAGFGALGGGIGGAIGNAVSPIAKAVENNMPSLADIHENIANKYINLHNKANNLYNATSAAAKEFDNNFPNGITTPEYTAKAQEILNTLSNEKGAPSALHPDLLKTVSSITEKPQNTVNGLLNERQKLNNILKKIDLDAGSKAKITELKDAAQSDLSNLPDNVNPGIDPQASAALSNLQQPYMTANKLWAEMKGLAGNNATKRQKDLLENMVGASDYDDEGNIIGNNIDRSAFDKLYLSKPSTASTANNYDNLLNASGLDKNTVAHAIKNEPFNNETDPKAFHKFYKSLSKDKNAKQWLFSPNEQEILNKAVTRKNAKLQLPLFIGAEALAHKMGYPILGSSFAAYLAAKAGSKSLNKLLSKEISPKMFDNNVNNIFNRGNSNSGLDTLERRSRVIPSAIIAATLGGNTNAN